MNNWDINLPSWAYNLGYRLVGGRGAYNDLELWKGFEIVKVFKYYEIPNIIELEEFIEEYEGLCLKALI